MVGRFCDRHLLLPRSLPVGGRIFPPNPVAALLPDVLEPPHWLFALALGSCLLIFGVAGSRS